MKFALLSDVHLLGDKPIGRIDDIKTTQFVKFRFILDWCRDNNAILLQAGDLVNRPRNWYLLPEIMDILKEYGVKIFCVAGQHDVYMYSRDAIQATSLGILEKAGLVNILPPRRYHLDYIDSDISIYGASYGQMLPEPQTEGFNIGVIHASIAEHAIYPGQNYMDALTFLKDNPKYDIILCGDIHQKFMKTFKGRFILNSGPMIRKEASAYNFQHHPGFWAYDTEKDGCPEWVEIPHEKAELVLSRAHIDQEELTNSMLDEFIKSIPLGDQISEASFIDNLWIYVKKNKIEKPVVDIITEIVNR
jgi:DNA repair exonuclease SbcCD nuclease subunit